MLLTTLRSGERGSALMAVIAIMAITGVIALVVGTVTVNALAVTQNTRTSVQAQAAAEAGIDATLAALRANGCSGTDFTSTSAAPFYTARISFSTGGPTAGYTEGCPTATGFLRILSTGAHTAAGLTAPEARSHRIEGVYHTTVTSAEVTGTGPAVYSYFGTGLSGSGELLGVNGSRPSIHVKTGDFTCNSQGTGRTDIVVADGDFTATGSCETANVWASGTAEISGSAQVNGNLVSAGTAKMSGSAQVNGNVVSSDSGPIPVAAPVVGDWINFVYAWSDWPGFIETTIGDSCDYTALQNAATSLGDAPGIIDARGCTDGIKIAGSDEVNMANDLVILAKSFSLSSKEPFTAKSPRKLWLITPDTTPDQEPTCLADPNPNREDGATPEDKDKDTRKDDFSLQGNVTLDSLITAMVYTPCRANLTSGTTFTGQVYSSLTTIHGNATLNYVPLGLPRVDLDTGAAAGAAAASTIGQAYSVRDYVGE
ncbi:MAG: hypothetical protein R6W83_05480 [Cryobacterium sp.]